MSEIRSKLGQERGTEKNGVLPSLFTTERSRATLAIITDIPYGRRRLERFDLYAADWERVQRPVVILIPGMWQHMRERTHYAAVARALVDDGVAVAIPEYSSLSSAWPQQLHDLQRAVVVIAREAAALGGDPQRLILFGEGFGAFLALQLLGTQHREHWLPPAQGQVVAWMSIDGQWPEDNLQHLSAKHPLRQLFAEPKLWRETAPQAQVRFPLPPGFMVQLSMKELKQTESFVRRILETGGDITLLMRSENSSRLWRHIGRTEHPLRVSWRPWLYCFGAQSGVR